MEPEEDYDARFEHITWDDDADGWSESRYDRALKGKHPNAYGIGTRASPLGFAGEYDGLEGD
jgi:hypothetical protein